MSKEDTYSIPIYENGVKTEWSVDGIIGDEKYFKLLELGNGKDLPDMINTTTKQQISMNKLDKLIECGAELARKHEEKRDEILNNPDVPQELKDIIIESRIPDDKIVDLTGGKRIKYINPNTFEIEYE